jgi:hypothetical protein
MKHIRKFIPKPIYQITLGIILVFAMIMITEVDNDDEKVTLHGSSIPLIEKSDFRVRCID